jgi:hypothetical protein
MKLAVVGKGMFKLSTFSAWITEFFEEPRPASGRDCGRCLTTGDLLSIDCGSIEVECELTETLKVCVKDEY